MVFAGLPGSGKSMLARGAADALGATYLRIDSIESAIVSTLMPYRDNPVAGGLAVINDVPKTLVYRLSRYVNSRQPVIPETTLEKPPSAELRPGQMDSDSLPPYEVLDAILEDYVEDAHSAEQIARERGFDLDLVKSVVYIRRGKNEAGHRLIPLNEESLAAMR